MISKMAMVYTDTVFLNHISQITSKSILKELSNTETLPEYDWSYHEPYLHRNASTLSHMLEEIALTDIESLQIATNSSLRLALLWENLSRLNENTPKRISILNSAIAYELAGYQANSLCLSRNFQKDDQILKSRLELLISTFLQRQFLKLKIDCNVYLKPNYDSNRDDMIQNLGLAVTASGLINCSNFFLSGSENDLDLAKSKFLKVEELFAKTKNYEESNLLHSLRSLIDVMKSKTTWTVLKDYTSNFLWDRYLKLLARGLGDDLVNSSSISELWPSQLESLKNGLLTSNNSKIIKMPTSAGKTRIAELAIVNTLTKNPAAKCVYIAPYRALVSELEKTFVSVFADLGFNVSSILGFYENDPFERNMINDSDLLITTPEKLDLLLRSKPDFFDNVDLIIFDEGHVLNLRERGIKIELLLTRLKKKLPQTRFLLLSAVISDQTMDEFIDWFNIERDDAIKLDWKPTIKQHAKFEWTSTSDVGKLSYESRPENQLNEFYVNSIITHKSYSYKNPKTGRKNSVTFPSIAKNETAAELGFKYSQLGPVLIFAPIPRLVTAIANALNRRLEYTIKTEGNLPSHFQKNTSRSAKIAEEWFGVDNEITILLKKGIGIHYGDLPDVLKRAIESDFREKKFNVVIATNTLSQGVNFPIKTIIIHSCRRFDEKKKKMVRLTANEYWNLSGRVGRAGYETEGTVIHIVSESTDGHDYNYYLAKQKELEPINGSLFNLLEDLIEKRITDKDLRQIIDPEILGILAEESAIGNYEEEIDDIISNSLVASQIKKYPTLAITQLNDVFKNIAKNIITTNSNHELLKIYSNTGLSSTSCKSISDFIENHVDEIKIFMTKNDYKHIPPLISLIFEVIGDLPEMNSKYTYGGDKMELLELWLSGKNFSDIFNIIDETNTRNVTKFIENYFGYHSPWGISSFIQIATNMLHLSEDDIPIQIKYLPSMVKNGVPKPEISWAIQIGIPFKDIAINIAREYIQKTESPEYGDFVSWIASIDNEDLIHEYHLESPFLDDVSKIISRLGVNTLLKEKRELSHVLNETTWIRGIQYENRHINASQVKVGDEIDVIRDYLNLYDRNAIKLFFQGRDLGFISRQLSQYLAPVMDGGTKISGKVMNTKQQNIPQIELKLT